MVMEQLTTHLGKNSFNVCYSLTLLYFYLYPHILLCSQMRSRTLDRQEIGRGGGNMKENWWDQFEHFNHCSTHA